MAAWPAQEHTPATASPAREKRAAGENPGKSLMVNPLRCLSCCEGWVRKPGRHSEPSFCPLRLYKRVASLERELKAVKVALAQEQAKGQMTTAVEPPAGKKAPTVRFSPRLIRSLRGRLPISQAQLAKPVGVSSVAVGS